MEAEYLLTLTLKHSTMKILLILKSLSGGGSEAVVVNTANMLVQNGHEVDLVSMGTQHDILIEDSRINLHLGVAKKTKIKAKIIQEWRLRRYIKKLNKKYDLVLSNFFSRRSFLPSSLLKNTYFYLHFDFKQVHQNYLAISEKKAHRLTKKLRGHYNGKNVISVSDGASASLTTYFDVNPKNIVTIHNFFDLKKIQTLSTEPLPITVGPYILHPARFDVTQKRQDLLFDAFKDIPQEYQLVLLTKKSKQLDEMIHKYGLEKRVIVTGFQTNPYNWMKNARLVVLCSDYEGFGNVLAESLICQTPTVSTDCASGPREILTGELAKGLVPCGTSENLKAKMLEYLSEPVIAKEEDVMRFGFDNACKKLLQLCQNTDGSLSQG